MLPTHIAKSGFPITKSEVTTQNAQMWLLTQIKAYGIPMKDCNLICGTFHLRRPFPSNKSCVRESETALVYDYPP